jgi:hypothetical protein
MRSEQRAVSSLDARLNLSARWHHLSTKKKEAYQSRYTCPFDRKHKKKGLRDRDPEHNTPKHRSGQKHYNKILTRTIRIVTILSHLCRWPNQDFKARLAHRAGLEPLPGINHDLTSPSLRPSVSFQIQDSESSQFPGAYEFDSTAVRDSPDLNGADQSLG